MTENIKTILAALFLMPILYSCQSDFVQENLPISPEETAVAKKISVKAFIPDSESTRAQITYGNQDENKENFKWNLNDEINIINYSKFFEKLYGVKVEVERISNNGKSAEFSSIDSKDLNIEIGDTILVIYGEINSIQGDRDTNGELHWDPRKIFKMGVGTEGNKPQYLINNPKNGKAELDDSLSYMRHNLKMYDFFTADKDDVIPDIHFKHLSSILRITLHNNTDSALYPTKLEFKYYCDENNRDNNIRISKPTGNPIECFLNTFLYCSIKHDEENGSRLVAYDTDDFFHGSAPYTASIGTTINGKNGTRDIGDSIISGQSYDLYLSTVPRLGNNLQGNKWYIDLIVRHDTDHPYSIILDPETLGIKEDLLPVIEPGKRYWFDLTAVKDKEGNRKLILSSKLEEWLKQQE